MEYTLMITAQHLIDDAYAVCRQVLDSNDTSDHASLLFYQASERVCSFQIYGPNKPLSKAALLDVWEFFTDDEKLHLENDNHVLYQAVVAINNEA
jgi:hypothetical protein